MKSLGSCLIGAAALVAGVLASGAASAQGTWNLGGSGCSGLPTSATCAGNGGSLSATMTAWGGSASSFVQYNLVDWNPTGLGAQGAAETGTSPNHAFDNLSPGGSQEFMFISFGSAKVNLSSLQIGWSGGTGVTGADMSIYRWDGNSAATNTTGTAAAGWSLVSSLDAQNNGVGCDNPNSTTASVDAACRRFDASAGAVSSSTSLYSSWWLISTYVGAANAGKGLDAVNNDSFKLLSFTAGLCTGRISGGSSGGSNTTNNNNGSSCLTVPEPGSLALVGLALTGVYAVRRRSFKQPAQTLRLAAA